MEKETVTRSSPSGLPGVRRTTLLGAVLGAIASVAISGCLALSDLFVYGIYQPLVHQGTPFPLDLPWDDPFFVLFFLLISVLNVLALALFAVVPATLGGAAIGFVLQTLALHSRLTLWSRSIIGGCVGCGAGLATAALMQLSYKPGAQWNPTADPIWTGILGAVIGLLLSWLIGHWLRRRMR